MATVVVIITSMVVANATQTITTPNAASISYNLAFGASSAPITPVTNKPVLVMGCCTTTNAQSVGVVSLIHAPGLYIASTGLDPYSPAAIRGERLPQRDNSSCTSILTTKWTSRWPAQTRWLSTMPPPQRGPVI